MSSAIASVPSVGCVMVKSTINCQKENRGNADIIAADLGGTRDGYFRTRHSFLSISNVFLRPVLRNVFRLSLVPALLGTISLSTFAQEEETVNLTILSEPENSGVTEPSGILSATTGTPLQLTAEANVGWQFEKWIATPAESVIFDNEDEESAIALPSADAEITALFKSGPTYSLTTSVYPEGAGSVVATPSGQLNIDEIVRITAIESSQDSLFFKWTCSDGAELLDPESSTTELSLSEGASATEVTLTAHFLTRYSETGSAQFKSSFRGNISSLCYKCANKALFTADLPADMTDITVGENSILTMMFNSGAFYEERPFSENAKLKINKRGGSAFFRELIPGTKKAFGDFRIKWNTKGFTLKHKIKPPRKQNYINLYSEIYKRGDGKTFPIDSSQTGGMPVIIIMEDEDWCFLWSVSNGLEYSGEAKSSPSRKMGDDIVSWDLAGKGEIFGFSWRKPNPKSNKITIPSKRARNFHGIACNAVRKSALARAFSKADIDTGGVTQYPIYAQPGYSNYLPQQIQAPFFFNGKVYALSRPTSSAKAETKQFAYISMGGFIDQTGLLKFEKSYPLPVGDPKVALFGDATRATTCVFKGKVYLFYDIYTSDQYFQIYACKSSHPDVIWENIGFLPMKGTYRYQYQGKVKLKRTALKAVSFNGKIYLIYGAPDGSFHIQSSPDGKNWTHVYTLNDAASWGTKYLGMINACVVTKNAQPMLCIVILGTEKNDRWMYLRFIDCANKLVGGCHFYLDWVSPHHGVGIAAGTLKGSTANQAVQIFAQNSSLEDFTHPRTCTIDVETYNFEGWRDLPFKLNRTFYTDAYAYCDAVETAMPIVKTAGEKDLRMIKRIVMLSNINWWHIGAVTLNSDLYCPEGDPVIVNSTKGKTRDKSSWTLVGVIHGVPPFTRNGEKSKTSISQIEYTRTSAQGSSHDYTFEAEAWLNLAGMAQVTAEDQGVRAEIGANLKDTLSAGAGWKEKVESTTKSTFYCNGNNNDGALGHLVYLAPTLKSQAYCMYDQSGKIKLLSYNVINVRNLNLEFEEFKLKSPPGGMAARAPATDLKFWEQQNHTNTISYDPYYFDVYSNSITATQSKGGEGALSRNWEEFFNAGNKTSLNVYANGYLLFVLGVKGEFGVGINFGFQYSQSDSWGETMTYNLSEIPEPEAGSQTQIDKIVVEATWYYPKPDASLTDVMRPEWVPDQYMKQKRIPWLLSWEVSSFK